MVVIDIDGDQDLLETRDVRATSVSGDSLKREAAGVGDIASGWVTVYPREAVIEEGVSDPNSVVLTHLCRGDSVTVNGLEVIPGLDDSGVYPSFPLQCEELGQVEGLGANVD